MLLKSLRMRLLLLRVPALTTVSLAIIAVLMAAADGHPTIHTRNPCTIPGSCHLQGSTTRVSPPSPSNFNNSATYAHGLTKTGSRSAVRRGSRARAPHSRRSIIFTVFGSWGPGNVLSFCLCICLCLLRCRAGLSVALCLRLITLAPYLAIF